MIDSRATRMLAFATGEFDITFPADISVPLMKDVKARAPNAICEMITTGTLIQPDGQPRQSAVRQSGHSQGDVAGDRPQGRSIRILMDGLALIGGAMLPKPAGEWGMPPEMVASLTGYGPDTAKNIAEAQAIMQKLGYSDAKPLPIKIQTRNLPTYRDAAVILDRPAQEDLYRRRTGYSGDAAMVRAAGAQGLHHRAERHRRQRRRSRRQHRRELFLQVGAQLYAVLQRRGGQAAGGAIARTRQGEAQEDRLGYRAHSGRRRGASDHHLQRRRPIAGSPMSGITSRTTTASTTACGSRKSGWINRLGDGEASSPHLGRFVVPIKN